MSIAKQIVFVGLFLSFAGANAPPDEGDAKKQAELKWAKGVAVDFLAAVQAADSEPAEMLLTADFKKRLGDIPNWLFRVPNSGLQKGHIFAEEEISPDQDEASFKGLLIGEKTEAEYSLRVVKEKEGGRWRVNFFRYGEVHDRPAEKK